LRNIWLRAFFARATPMAVLTSFSSSGGGVHGFLPLLLSDRKPDGLGSPVCFANLADS
jgi:hypothetical protein